MNYQGGTMATMNVSLPDQMRDWIESRVKSGFYANASDYIRDLVRHDQHSQTGLEAALTDGLTSGRSPRGAEEIMAEEKSRLAHGRI
jgi:antitoxin ParD1/3/4